MGLISPFTTIRAISLFHLTAAYFFLTAPGKVSDQNVVYILGESMRMSHATSLDTPTDASAFIAVILAFFGLSDLTAASLTEEVSVQYWLAVIPTRLMFLFTVTGYTYLFKEGGLFGSAPGAKASMGETLQNSLVFTWGFMETAAWFWVFTSMREERRNVARRRLEMLKAEQDAY